MRAKKTNVELIRLLRCYANLDGFGGGLEEGVGDSIRKVTRIYRDTWMNPVIDEIEQRLVKSPKVRP